VNTGTSRDASLSIAGQVFTVSQVAVTPCNYSVNPTSITNISPDGTTRSVTITTTSTCAWSVSGLPSWITANQASGTGSGSAALRIQDNPGGQRSVELTIAGRTVTVIQDAFVCGYSLNRTSITNVSATGATETVGVSTTAGCSWSVGNLPSWISANPTSGTDSGDVSLTIEANAGAQRSANVTIAGRGVSISQEAVACGFTLNPTSLSNLASTGATESVAITTTSACFWSVSGLPPWISANPTSGTGSGSVTLTIQANGGPQRNDDLTIAGHTFNVAQNAVAVCSYALNPTGLPNVTAAARTPPPRDAAGA
jgi:hypothetical protein